MVKKELSQEQEWITKVRLAHYKRLSNTSVLENSEQEMLAILKDLLLNDGITEEIINQEVCQYGELSEEERIKEMIEKAEALVSQIVTYLGDSEEISSKDYPELYHRIQELLALDSTRGSDLINEALEREKISHFISCGSSLYGGPCTYYFSKKISYRRITKK